MYDAHFGLTDRPFQLTPDPRFWFDTATHKKAMAYLGYGLAQGEGFIVITGEIGAGKTTLLGHLVDRIDPANLNVIKIVSTAIAADDLLRIVATGLGVDPAAKSKAELLLAIEHGLHAVARTGRRTLLIVDEAQALAISALEELRMLSNFQSGGHALVQIFLLGQPEFRERLHGADRLEQLRQRVIATHHLDPMGAGEVRAYVEHRLTVVGWNGRPELTEDAYALLHHVSDGVPRRLNQLMSRVLLHAAVTGSDRIDALLVRDVADDHRREVPGAPVPDMRSRAPEPEAAPEPEPELEPMPEPDAGLAPEPLPEPDIPPPAAAVTSLLEHRIALLEERVAQQDVALRRVLTLMVDWVESGAGELRGAA